MSLNRIPTYLTPLETNTVTTKGWYFFWQGLMQGQPTQTVSAIVPGASPYSYVALIGGTVLIQGGTVSLVEYSRDGVTFYDTGVTSGMFPVSMGDTIRTTWSMVPNMAFIPR